MPRFNGTGPQGVGPMTGRGLGPCNGGLGLRRGLGRGRGLGRCWWWNFPQVKKEDKLEMLVSYRKALEEELADIEKEEQEM